MKASHKKTRKKYWGVGGREQRPSFPENRVYNTRGARLWEQGHGWEKGEEGPKER